jgi:hypothetical protein
MVARRIFSRTSSSPSSRPSSTPWPSLARLPASCQCAGLRGRFTMPLMMGTGKFRGSDTRWRDPPLGEFLLSEIHERGGSGCSTVVRCVGSPHPTPRRSSCPRDDQRGAYRPRPRVRQAARPRQAARSRQASRLSQGKHHGYRCTERSRDEFAAMCSR